MPAIIAKSISILSDAGLGMAMFSLGRYLPKDQTFGSETLVYRRVKALSLVVSGLFMALQPRIIACGNGIASFAMVVRFVTGPAVMAAASIAVGLRGGLLHVAVVQVLLV